VITTLKAFLMMTWSALFVRVYQAILIRQDVAVTQFATTVQINGEVGIILAQLVEKYHWC
jgi:hypothetical protein